jgi:AcrR family transcriptional regulator
MADSLAHRNRRTASVTEGSAPGGKRSEASRRAILDAAYELLEKIGFDGLSIEGIAARAGVGKTTIYRWWSSKGVLAVEAFLDAVAPSIAFRQTASANADIRRQMRALAELYRGPTGRFVRELIGSSQSDPEMRQAFIDGFLTPRREAARAVFQRGSAAGEFRAGLDPDTAIDALYGPIYYRLLTSGAPIDETFVDQLADCVFRGIST